MDVPSSVPAVYSPSTSSPHPALGSLCSPLTVRSAAMWPQNCSRLWFLTDPVSLTRRAETEAANAAEKPGGAAWMAAWTELRQEWVCCSWRVWVRVGWGGLKNCPPDRPVAPSGQTRGFSSPQHWNNKRGSTVALNSFKLFLKKKYPLLLHTGIELADFGSRLCCVHAVCGFGCLFSVWEIKQWNGSLELFMIWCSLTSYCLIHSSSGPLTNPERCCVTLTWGTGLQGSQAEAEVDFYDLLYILFAEQQMKTQAHVVLQISAVWLHYWSVPRT